MKTEITFKEKFFWNQHRDPEGKVCGGKPYWILLLNGFMVVVFKNPNDLWEIEQMKWNSIFYDELEFKDDAKAKAYVESKLLKWIKSIINIRI